MLVKSLGAILFIVAMTVSSMAQVMRSDELSMPPAINSIKTEPGTVHPTATMLTEIVNWLSANFDLPAVKDHPRIEFVPAAKLASMRYEDIKLRDSSREASAHGPVGAAQQRDVVALYDDKTETMFLSDTWTGTTPAERSVVVHEMVHHLQNLGKLAFECPQAREKQAYGAQDEWLKRFGTDLETEFGLDPFTLLVSSSCMF